MATRTTRTNKRCIALAAWLSAFSLVLAACGGGSGESDGSADDESTALTVVTLSGQLLYFPFQLAVANGAYEKAGLDVEEIIVGSGSDASKLFLGGKVDGTATAVSHTFLGSTQGRDVKIVQSFTSDAALEVVTRKKANIAAGDWSALKGKTCGATGPGSDTDLLLRALLDSNGVRPDKDVTIQYTGGAGAAIAGFQQGTLDCFLAIPGMRAQLLLEDLAVPFFELSKSEMADNPSAGLSLQGEIVRDRPDVVRKFVEVTLAQVQSIYDDPEAAKKAAQEIYEGLSPEAINADLDFMIESKAFSLDGLQSEDGFDKKIQLYVDAEVLPSKPKYDDVYVNTFLSN